MRCPLPLNQLARRLQVKSYSGRVSIGIGTNYNYAYALSDTVPQGRYWVVLYASSFVGQFGGVNLHFGLWSIVPGVLPVGNLQPYQRNTWFFQGDVIPSIANGPPVGPYAMRVDDINDDPADNYVPGAERVLIRSRKLIVPGGFTLMAYGGASGFGNGGSVGEQFQFQIAVADFASNEIQDVEF